VSAPNYPSDVRKQATALAYDNPNRDAAPRVVAKGYGIVAEMIVQRAKEAGLYVHESPEMVSLLMQVDLDARIPPALYQAVAELLAWLYRLENGDAAGESAPSPAPLSPTRNPRLPR
jgi:flagellar biosynthesis protein